MAAAVAVVPADIDMTRAASLLLILMLGGCASWVSPHGPVAAMPDRSNGGGGADGSGGGGMM